MTRQLIVLAGQSNAVGGGYASEAPSSITGNYAATRFAEQINCYNDYPAACDLTETWGDLHIRSGTYMGAEITLGRAVGNCALIKCATNGTSLAGDWNPSVSTGTQCFQRMLDFIAARIADLGEATDTPTLVWIQGETDADAVAFANAYQTNLTAMIAAWRGVYAGSRVVISALSTRSARPYQATVRAAQQAIADADPLVKLVPTDDLPLRSDDTHYTTDSFIKLGARISDYCAIDCTGWADVISGGYSTSFSYAGVDTAVAASLAGRETTNGDEAAIYGATDGSFVLFHEQTPSRGRSWTQCADRPTAEAAAAAVGLATRLGV